MSKTFPANSAPIDLPYEKPFCPMGTKLGPQRCKGDVMKDLHEDFTYQKVKRKE